MSIPWQRSLQTTAVTLDHGPCSWDTWLCVCVLAAQSWPTVWLHELYSPPGSSVHGSLQARTLEWVAITFSRGSSWPKDQIRVLLHCRHLLYCLDHLGRPWTMSLGYFPKGRLVSQFSLSVMSNSLWPHGLQHTKLPCPSPTPRAYSNSCPSHKWCHRTISSSVVPFSPHL